MGLPSRIPNLVLLSFSVCRKRGDPGPLSSQAGALTEPKPLSGSPRGWTLLLLAKPIQVLASCYIGCNVKVSRGIVFSLDSYIVPFFFLQERISSLPESLDLDPGYFQCMSTNLLFLF